MRLLSAFAHRPLPVRRFALAVECLEGRMLRAGITAAEAPTMGNTDFSNLERVGLALESVQQGQDIFVVANEAEQRITDYTAQADPTFHPQLIADHIDCRAVACGDLNGSGLPDLVAADTANNRILIAIGRPDGSFGPWLTWSTGLRPLGITLADLNGDGHLEIIVANQGSNTVSILYGQGSGANWSVVRQVDLPVGSAPVFTTVQDVVGNGRPDLFVVNSGSNTVEQFRQAPDGSFDLANPITYDVGQSPQAVFVGHFDTGPGLDLVSLNEGSNDLTFFDQPSFTSAPPGPGRSISLDGLEPIAGVMRRQKSNGMDELAVADYGSGAVSFVLGSSSGPAVTSVVPLTGMAHPTDVALSRDGQSIFVAGQGAESVVSLGWPTADLAPTPTDQAQAPMAAAPASSTAADPGALDTVLFSLPEAPLAAIPVLDISASPTPTPGALVGPELPRSGGGGDEAVATNPDAGNPAAGKEALPKSARALFRFASGQEDSIIQAGARARERLVEEDRPDSDISENHSEPAEGVHGSTSDAGAGPVRGTAERSSSVDWIVEASAGVSASLDTHVLARHLATWNDSRAAAGIVEMGLVAGEAPAPVHLNKQSGATGGGEEPSWETRAASGGEEPIKAPMDERTAWIWWSMLLLCGHLGGENRVRGNVSVSRTR